jgi:hypothetical protein
VSAKRLILLALLCAAAVPSHAVARIVPTWSIEYAAERADLIVLGHCGDDRNGHLEVVVDHVLHGDASKRGDTILVHSLGGYKTSVRQPQKAVIDLKQCPILLCLSRKAIRPNEPANAFEFDTTGYGSAIKVIDGQAVYGYYAPLSSQPYELQREWNSREELLRRIDRGIVLGRAWARVNSIKDRQAREQAALEFLSDRTLPSHFCWKACADLSGTKLIAVVRDEVENVKDPPADDGEERKSYPDTRGWKRLAAALMWVKDDGRELLPLLQAIKAKRPHYYDSAVRCAAQNCGPPAVPFLRQAMFDAVEYDRAAEGLCRIGTPEARTALEEALKADIEENGATSLTATRDYATKWPDGWKAFAARLEKDYPHHPTVQEYLGESWKNLVRAGVFKAADVPPRYRPAPMSAAERPVRD